MTPPNRQLQVEKGEVVAVRKSPGSWVRGRVQMVVSGMDGLFVKVFLVDWGNWMSKVGVSND